MVQIAEYERRLVEQSRPVGPLQALRYHWLAPEEPPSFLELVLLPALVISFGIALAVTESVLPHVAIVAIPVTLAIGVTILWWLVVHNIRVRKDKGKIER